VRQNLDSAHEGYPTIGVVRDSRDLTHGIYVLLWQQRHASGDQLRKDLEGSLLLFC